MSTTHEENWESCPSGALATFSATQRQIVQRRKLVRVGSSVVATVALVVLAGFFLLRPPTEEVQAYGCQATISRMDGYLAGSLPPDEQSLVRTHLEHCEKCNHHFQERADQLGVTFSLAMRTTWQLLPPSLRLTLASSSPWPAGIGLTGASATR